MTCEYCNNNILSKWKNKNTRFCSRTCSNKFRKDNTTCYDVISTKLKAKILNGESFGFHNITESERKNRTYVKKSWEDKVMSRPFEDLSWDYKRRRVIIEQDNKCVSCNLSNWLDNPITLEVDHIDGNTQNNDRLNLRALCPNCHSLTNTFRGRNNIRGKFPSSVDFYKIYNEVGNIRQTLLHFKLAPKGGNYSKAKQLIQNENMYVTFETKVNAEL